MPRNDEKLKAFADLLTTEQARRYAKDYPRLNQPVAVVKVGKKYARVDLHGSPGAGGSGMYMVDEEGNIFGIKAYGVIHRGHRYGTLDTIHG